MKKVKSKNKKVVSKKQYIYIAAGGALVLALCGVLLWGAMKEKPGQKPTDGGQTGGLEIGDQGEEGAFEDTSGGTGGQQKPEGSGDSGTQGGADKPSDSDKPDDTNKPNEGNGQFGTIF